MTLRRGVGISQELCLRLSSIYILGHCQNKTEQKSDYAREFRKRTLCESCIQCIQTSIGSHSEWNPTEKHKSIGQNHTDKGNQKSYTSAYPRNFSFNNLNSAFATDQLSAKLFKTKQYVSEWCSLTQLPEPAVGLYLEKVVNISRLYLDVYALWLKANYFTLWWDLLQLDFSLTNFTKRFRRQQNTS